VGDAKLRELSVSVQGEVGIKDVPLRTDGTVWTWIFFPLFFFLKKSIKKEFNKEMKECKNNLCPSIGVKIQKVWYTLAMESFVSTKNSYSYAYSSGKTPLTLIDLLSSGKVKEKFIYNT
jgi:hypothetical protein